MKEGTLVIGGKTYISSARAAQLVGYTKDYVGQLARAGKIDSKIIGRSWYVAEDSITQHKLTVHYILTKPKKTRQVKNNNEIHSNEKTKENIVKSTVSVEKSVSESVKIHDRETITRVENNFDGTQEFFGNDNNDLYPVLKKNRSGNDPLLHSEIYYEPVKSTDFEENNQETRDEKEKIVQETEAVFQVPFRKSHLSQFSRSNDVRSMPTRTTRMNGSAGPTARDSRQSTSQMVDGIVMPRMQKIKTPTRYHQDGYDYDEVQRTPSIEFEEEEGYATENIQTRHKKSRAIPILGALGIFLVLSLLYLIF